MEKRAAVCRMICLMDATGSMKTSWQAAVGQVDAMLPRINEISGGGQLMIKWVAYRDYDLRSTQHGGVVQSSEWTDNAADLSGFVRRISCGGGGSDENGAEAIEMALKLCNDEPKEMTPTRVLVMGDAPPHPQKKGERLPKFSQMGHVLETDYQLEIRALKEKNVKVDTFYMKSPFEAAAREAFSIMSTETGGKMALLDPSSDSGVLDAVCTQALDDIGGKGMVLEYKKKFMAFS
jgi:hypothetical protein